MIDSDLQDKLNQILQNPEAMKQVQSLGAQLGLTGEQKQPPKPKPPENNLMSVLGGDDTIGTIAKFAPLLSSLNNSDDTTRLLDSLRPFLSHERQEKLDKAEKMLKLFRLMPLLRENGLFFLLFGLFRNFPSWCFTIELRLSVHLLRKRVRKEGPHHACEQAQAPGVHDQ